MARIRNYDDLSDSRVSRGGSSSTKIVLAVIILSVLISIIAVLVWIKILETQDAMNTASSKPATEQTTKVVETIAENKPETTPAAPIQEPATVPAELSIDEALSVLEATTESSGVSDYLSSSDYGTDATGEEAVSEQSVEMKKPTIAQNLQLSRQSSFSKDMVMYQEYSIKANDTLNSIAESFGLSLQTIVSVNQITSAASLWIGSTLMIPDRDGSLYIVKEGDTLLSITQQFGLAMSPKVLGEVNGILEDDLVVGQKLFIPYETMETSGTITASEGESFIRPAQSATTVGIYNQKVVNPITDGSLQLDGVLLQAPAGTAVLASAGGTVIDKGFNENGSGFVKVLHSNGYTTYYDYLAEILVESTDKVEQGQQIGSFGDTVVFFQIKQDGIPFDPESFFIR